MAAFKEKQTDAWFRPLNDGRLEVMCKAPGYRLRIACPEAQAWAAVELFESWTDLRVECARRPPRKVPVAPGQLALVMEMDHHGEAA